MIVDYDNPSNDPCMPYRCPICFAPVMTCLETAMTHKKTFGCTTMSCDAPIFVQQYGESQFTPLIKWNKWVINYRKEHPNYHREFMCKGCELENVNCDFYDENAMNCLSWKSKEMDEEESREVILEDVYNFDKKEMEGFITGLKDGRKEKCLEQNNDGTIRPCEVMKDNTTLRSEKENLEKENAELKEKLKEESYLERIKRQSQKIREMNNAEKREYYCNEIKTACSLTIHGDTCYMLNMLDLPQETAAELSQHYNKIISIINDWNNSFKS